VSGAPPISRAGAPGTGAGGSGAREDARAGTGADSRATGGAERERSWTVLELLQWTTDYFKRHGIESARLDAEVLLAHALETKRLRLYIDYEKPVLPAERDRFRALVARRARDRVPVSLLLGEREFWSLRFVVTSDVLTPRPETETLVEVALDRAKRWEAARAGAANVADALNPIRILDIGTGSGAIALSIASELPHAALTATDISEAALQIAARNADELLQGERVRLLKGDLFEPVGSERFDLILSNPPYIGTRMRDEAGSLPPELSHEPEQALFAGPDGLDVIRRLVAGAGEHLERDGWLFFELSPEQADEAERMLMQAGFEDVTRRFDLASRPRVVGARWPGEE